MSDPLVFAQVLCLQKGEGSILSKAEGKWFPLWVFVCLLCFVATSIAVIFRACSGWLFSGLIWSQSSSCGVWRPQHMQRCLYFQFSNPLETLYALKTNKPTNNERGWESRGAKWLTSTKLTLFQAWHCIWSPEHSLDWSMSTETGVSSGHSWVYLTKDSFSALAGLSSNKTIAIAYSA